MQRDHERATASLVSPRLSPWRTTARMRSKWASTLSDTRFIVSPLLRVRVTRCPHAGGQSFFRALRGSGRHRAGPVLSLGGARIWKCAWAIYGMHRQGCSVVAEVRLILALAASCRG